MCPTPVHCSFPTVGVNFADQAEKAIQIAHGVHVRIVWVNWMVKDRKRL